MRRQSEAATALWIRDEHGLNRIQSGVALRLPQHSNQWSGPIQEHYSRTRERLMA